VRVAELIAKRPAQRQRQSGPGVKELPEVGSADGDEVAGTRGAHRGRSRRIRQQRQLAECVAAAELADHGVGGLINDLESASADDVYRVGRLVLAEQPFPGGQMARM
jgi:hypothetical protein